MSGRFETYDFGQLTDTSKSTLPYDLTKVSTPVAIFWAKDDVIVSPTVSCCMVPNWYIKVEVIKNIFSNLNYYIIAGCTDSGKKSSQCGPKQESASAEI